MVEAYILIQVASGVSHQVAAQLRCVSGVVEAHAVMGPYDVITFVRVADADEMGDLIVGQMHTLPDIWRTLTCSVIPSGAVSSGMQR
jgi:DNA-binding Lrp family transcriptional regulator